MAPPLIALVGALILIPLGIIAVLYLLVPLFKAIGWLVRQVFRFTAGEIGDALRFIGALVTQVFLFPLIIINVLIGRWSASGHFGRALKSEFKTSMACLYRMAIGHPARLLCLTALTDGLENRLPEVMAAAPTSDRPRSKTSGQFDGYTIVGSLPGGGSGAKLYVAQPDAMKLAIFARGGRPDVRQVVIKTFSLRDGSSLPQIVRESRALEAAKKLGLVLEHELSDERFYYVTEYVPGESLGLVTQRLHAVSGGEGLGNPQLRSVLTYGADLLKTLDNYHRGGLWHKDVKPDNIIVDGTQAHLVDFGLVTPLRSGMTLTTHGTEYFRDPEMVRLALKGVKVHQVDGARFDVYAAGAVLFSMIENSFPAHGGLSQITKRCPEALNWIVRRAMADYDKRYANSAAMLVDVEAVRQASDPFALKPIDLPSMRGVAAPAVGIPDDAPIRPFAQPAPVGAGSGAPGFAAGVAAVAAAGSPIPGAARQRPRLRVNRWWSGGYVVDDSVRENIQSVVDNALSQAHDAVTGAMAAVGFGGFGRGGGNGPAQAERAAWTPRNPGMTAREQVARARERVQAARERARARMAGRRRGAPGDFRPMNIGVGAAVFLFLAMCVGLVVLLLANTGRRDRFAQVVTSDGDGIVPGMAYARINLPDVDSDGTPGHPDLADRGISGTFAIQTSAPTAVQISNKNLPAPRTVINGVPSGSDARPLAAPAPKVHGERALVISDVVPLTPGMTAAISRLSEAGFVVLGNYPGNTASAEQVAAQDQLAAEARAIRNVSPLTAADTSEALSHWVTDQNNLNLLVWFSKPDPTKDKVQAFVFSPWHDASVSAREGESDRATLQSALGALQVR